MRFRPSKEASSFAPEARLSRAFLCEHLADGAANLGVSYERSLHHPWPSMICDDCANAPALKRSYEPLTSVCGSCWDEAFGRNSKVRNANPDAWLSSAFRRGSERYLRWFRDFDIRRLSRWRLHLDARPPWMALGRAGSPLFEVGCQPVVLGSWDPQGPDWLWSWGNTTLPLSRIRPIVRVKRAGERLGIQQLWRTRFDCSEPLATNLCMVALDLLPAFEGIYRTVHEDGLVVMFAVRRTERFDATR